MNKNILWGLAIIALGFLMGGSVFLGDFTLLNIIFDGLGVFFIIRGVVEIARSKKAA